MTPEELVRALPTFTVSSAGSIESVARLTLQSAEQSFPFLAGLLPTLGHTRLEPAPVESFATSEASRSAARALKVLFDKYGSDKANGHDYHHLYGAILNNPLHVTAVFEIGLGTNNEDVVSNMGKAGRPGASLRAFRDHLPNARIYGADVDRRVLFEEDRIRTFFIDQTDLQTIETLAEQIDEEFDLIIDDGLHAPNANLAALMFGLPKLKPGGVFVVEDIHPSHIPVWQTVAALLPAGRYQRFLATAAGGCLFVIQRAS